MTDEELLATIEHDDSYRVVRTLSEGPAGKTELVAGEGSESLVRKYVPRELANERAWQQLRELDHPLLPQVRDIYWLPDSLVVVTTYVDGVTLADLLAGVGPLSVTDAVHYLQDLCEAAGELHAHGIVHRDITPGNAVVNSGRAALIDLGNVRAYVSGAQRDTTTLGTWGFAAPEQFGFAQTDARTDIYALGGLLAFLLTGVSPNDDEFNRVLADEKRVPAALREVILRARAFEPSARYQSAQELAQAAAEAALLPAESDGGQAPAPKSSQPKSYDFAAQALDVAPKQELTTLRQRLGVGMPLSAGSKAALVLMWLVALCFVAAFISVGFDQSCYHRPGDVVYYPVAGLSCGVCTLLCMVDLHKLIVRRAMSTAGYPSSYGFVLKTLAKWYAIAFLIVFAAALFCTVFYG